MIKLFSFRTLCASIFGLAVGLQAAPTITLTTNSKVMAKDGGVVAVTATLDGYGASPKSLRVTMALPETHAKRISRWVGDPAHPDHLDGDSTNARFQSIACASKDASGNFFVLDAQNLRKISSNGDVSTVLTNSTTANRGMTVDSHGNIFLASGTKILKVSPQNEISDFAGGYGAPVRDGVGANAAFFSISALAIDDQDNLYVSDLNAIRKVTPSAAVTTLAGSVMETGYVDGFGVDARFDSATAVLVGSNGALFCVSHGSMIRRISPAGAVTTLCGSITTGYKDGVGTAAHFIDLTRLCFDGDGNVLAVDGGRIRSVNADGNVTTVLGQIASTSASIDGIGTQADIRWPSAIICGTGGVYAFEETVVRKITDGPLWSYVSSDSFIGGNVDPGEMPVTGQTGTISWLYTTAPTPPASFTFNLAYPAGETAPADLIADLSVNFESVSEVYTSNKIPLSNAQEPYFEAPYYSVKVLKSELIDFTVQAESAVPVTYSADGLPTGVAIDSTTGRITGSINERGEYYPVITATSDMGAGSTTVYFQVLAPAVINVSNLNTPYDGTAKIPTVNTTPGGLACNILYDGSSTPPIEPGSYPISIELIEPGYVAEPIATTLIISKGNPAFFITNLNQVYNGSARPVSVSTTPGDLPTTVTYSGSVNPPTEPGTYNVVATVNTSHYDGSHADTLTISKATPSIAWPAPISIAYGTKLSTAQLNASASVLGAYAYSPALNSVLNAGVNQKLSVVFTPADTAHYNSVTASTLINVTKAVLDVSAAETQQSYGAIDANFSPVYKGFLNSDDASSLSGTPLLTTTATKASPVGTYSISAAIGTLTSNNYVFTFSPGTLVVTKAPLNVSAAMERRIYGTNNPTFTAVFSGFMNGESISSLSGNPALTTDATPSSSAGTYDISASPGTLSSNNYYFTFTPGVLEVEKATLTVTANNASRLFAAPNPLFTASITGFVNSDDASVLWGSPTLTTTATQSSAGGLYPIVSSLGTLSASNYRFVFSNGVLTVLVVHHSADTDHNWRISLDELSRVIELFNSSTDAAEAGAYHSVDGSEDGFGPGRGVITTYHAADTNFDGKIDQSELLRVIELFSTLDGALRTGEYHVDLDSKDCYAPGPAPL